MQNNIPTWTEGQDDYGRTYRERDDGYREYMLDPDIAQAIIDRREGNGDFNTHTWRALSIAITGFECQQTGSELEKLARWTLGLEDT